MRNEAARQAIAEDATVLFFADADTWVPIQQMILAAIRAQETGKLTHAFEAYVRLGSNETKRGQASRASDTRTLARLGRRQVGHMSGASAISVGLWQALGGYDERFIGWGFEDRAFDMAAGCLGGGVERISGTAIHWYHVPVAEKSTRPRTGMVSVDLALRYCVAAAKIPQSGVLSTLASAAVGKHDMSNPDAMRAILGEPGGPLAPLVAEQASRGAS